MWPQNQRGTRLAKFMDFTTKQGVTVARRTRIHAGRCAQCRCKIIGGRKRKYCTPSCRKNARADRARNHVRTAKEIDYQNDYNRAYRQTTTGIRAQHRSRKKGRRDGTQGYRTREVYLAAQHRTYRNRRKQQLAYWHERGKYVGTDLVPTCADCGVEVPYTGRGRPRKRCPIHHRGRGKRR